ncbi:MAG: polysaccharide deacetylase family protein [Bacteroidales bacterium]|jgi:polysaccharide deacetylase family protein (PEP-CTERM system associated)|nr:polysaccharide deacetylase family protein [Bacteroidales bacterium]
MKDSKALRILSFDIEESYMLLEMCDNDEIFDPCSNMEEGMQTLFDLLDKHNIKSTFFVVGKVAKKHPELIRRLADRYEVGSHSMNHKPIYDMTKEEFRKDLLNSVNIIEDITGKKVKHYRAPGLSIHREQSFAFEAMAEAGIEIDSSLTNIKLYSYGHFDAIYQEPFIINSNGTEIKEYPVISKYMIGYSSGGYFRLLPYRLIKHITKKSDYIMSYFHLRDFDTQQQTISSINFIRRFKSYYGERQFLTKLNTWLNDFSFVDIKTADEQIDWANAPRLYL